MSDKNIYKKWAPRGMRWVEWVRPVLFVDSSKCETRGLKRQYQIPKIQYLKGVTSDTALFIDLPSYEGVLEGLACIQHGFRPIPLYNGTTPQDKAMALVDNTAIQEAIIWGSAHIEDSTLSQDAPPAFLLDRNRTLRYKMNPSVFDNSWDLYNQDIPSPEYFKAQGITKIMIRSESIQRDLVRIFYEFQKKGFVVYQTDGLNEPSVVRIPKPPKKDKFH